MEFEKWPQIPRINKALVFVSEKIDGTNAQIAINDETIAPILNEAGRTIVEPSVCTTVRAGSRKRWISQDYDNYGFAAKVAKYRNPLSKLLPTGRHYGEWAGPGIQRNPLKLQFNTFFSFNTKLFQPEYLERIQEEIPWFDVVPLWFQGNLEEFTKLLPYLKEGRPLDARQFSGPAEGFVAFISGTLVKWTAKGTKRISDGLDSVLQGDV